ncbi:MAG: hypothetical protein L6R42_001654 [Xanthoria sp. 1 TBL-2021]|nr:MAG: hypothetical protein L6R42_001654 [Xanthoria sp. 1 TBL-2021]
MPRLVRRRPLLERISAWLNPLDLWLWLSEGFDSSDWEQWQKDWSITVGISLNITFLIARANTGSRSRRRGDDVFGDADNYTGLTAWLATFTVHILSLLSLANAAYTFYRRRHYRLFECSIDAVPSTPSAHRVRVDSSPVSSSPLRFLSSMLAADNAASRSHPDATRDVWELAVWDPTPLSLRLFCLFSPGHILVYWLFLPTGITDPRPSTTVVTTIALIVLLSTQLTMLQSGFSQQSKDSTVVYKEVLNEYDTKFVHPRTRPLTRDVGTQYSNSSTSMNPGSASVDTYTPSIIINRGFHTRPNPNYMKHVDPDAPRGTPTRHYANGCIPSSVTSRDMSSPLRPTTAIRQPQFRPNGELRAGDGGNLGVYSHAHSPLRKSASTDFGDDRHRHRARSPVKGEGSPLKRSSLAPGTSIGQRRENLQNNVVKRERARS